ncbi:MAG TPA: hypothetical protein VK789_01695 [Bryobacteraceae bacterium]|nr:hypothetical protein [Bryobacteraceae bacterium]
MKPYPKTLLLFGACFTASAASIGGPPVIAPDAFAAITNADYCFAHTRALEYERQPPSYLVLHLHVKVAYKNNSSRPLIMPLGKDLTVYTALKPGNMKATPQPSNFPDDASVTEMKNLPADVNPENPIFPANDVFQIIAANGWMNPAFEEDVVLPVNHKTLLRHDPDLRGHRVYVRLQFDHQPIAPALEAQLSDSWVKFGVPWTGMLRTNTLTIDVPKDPPSAKPCVDTRIPERFDGHLQTGNNR